jgi:hypothetical protein
MGPNKSFEVLKIIFFKFSGRLFKNGFALISKTSLKNFDQQRLQFADKIARHKPTLQQLDSLKIGNSKKLYYKFYFSEVISLIWFKAVLQNTINFRVQKIRKYLNF